MGDVSTIKVPVSKTVIEDVEVELPYYGSWDADVADGRLSWETKFCINEKLEMRTVSKYVGGGKEWEMGIETLDQRQVGQYLKYPRETASEFHEWVDRATSRMGE